MTGRERKGEKNPQVKLHMETGKKERKERKAFPPPNNRGRPSKAESKR